MEVLVEPEASTAREKKERSSQGKLRMSRCPRGGSVEKRKSRGML